MKYTATEFLLENVKAFRAMAYEYLKEYRKTHSEVEWILYRKTTYHIEGLVSAISLYEGITQMEVIKLSKTAKPCL